jgi:hypothetical protein
MIIFLPSFIYQYARLFLRNGFLARMDWHFFASLMYDYIQYLWFGILKFD